MWPMYLSVLRKEVWPYSLWSRCDLLYMPATFSEGDVASVIVISNYISRCFLCAFQAHWGRDGLSLSVPKKEIWSVYLSVPVIETFCQSQERKKTWPWGLGLGTFVPKKRTCVLVSPSNGSVASCVRDVTSILSPSEGGMISVQRSLCVLCSC